MVRPLTFHDTFFSDVFVVAHMKLYKVSTAEANLQECLKTLDEGQLLKQGQVMSAIFNDVPSGEEPHIVIKISSGTKGAKFSPSVYRPTEEGNLIQV
ncbi:hypothetical protein BDN67DRAFT_1012387 [Paxillus ammoniavirescens]|nr:hypothetical protein BDN67DRAFT_1012387 [Paxillus ammoniavirescens]